MQLPGGESAARVRWGDRLAAGKFGLVTTPGKKPRLVGDGTISGANGRSRILEKVRLPSLDSAQRFISSAPAEQVWSALSFDVRGARKLVRVREDEQGYSCFVFEWEWYFYRSCFFGCNWAAYWFARVGSYFVRLLHRWIWLQHGLFLYVDDGLVLLPQSVSPLVTATTLMFLVALGVPLSWEKVDLQADLSWMGWRFDFRRSIALLPEDKRAKLCTALAALVEPGVKVERRCLERTIGLLLW